jgi:hypothetical protein
VRNLGNVRVTANEKHPWILFELALEHGRGFEPFEKLVRRLTCPHGHVIDLPFMGETQQRFLRRAASRA